MTLGIRRLAINLPGAGACKCNESDVVTNVDKIKTRAYRLRTANRRVSVCLAKQCQHNDDENRQDWLERSIESLCLAWPGVIALADVIPVVVGSIAVLAIDHEDGWWHL